MDSRLPPQPVIPALTGNVNYLAQIDAVVKFNLGAGTDVLDPGQCIGRWVLDVGVPTAGLVMLEITIVVAQRLACAVACGVWSGGTC